MKQMSTTFNRTSQMGFFILFMRFSMLIIFIFFSFIPFVSVINIILPQYFSNNIYFFILAGTVTIIIGVVTIISIITLNLDLRGLTTLVFSIGIIFSFDNPYFLAFGVVLSWLFYELWFVFARFYQLDKEYSSYKQKSFERQRLSRNLRAQLISFLIIGWITISLSWAVLYLSTNFYFELGREFGTLGIATSFTMITLVYLTQRLASKPSSQAKTNN